MKKSDAQVKRDVDEALARTGARRWGGWRTGQASPGTYGAHRETNLFESSRNIALDEWASKRQYEPTRAQRRDPKLPRETFAALDRYGNLVATSETVRGAMSHADRIWNVGNKAPPLTVRGEYTSDGHHHGIGKGRVVARREGGKWLVG